MTKQIHLSDHFSYRRLLKFTLPSIGMMVFTSIYGVVDGFFLSNFAGKTPFAAVNLIYPLLTDRVRSPPDKRASPRPPRSGYRPAAAA